MKKEIYMIVTLTDEMTLTVHADTMKEVIDGTIAFMHEDDGLKALVPKINIKHVTVESREK